MDKYAIIENDEIIDYGFLHKLWPDVGFPSTGPTEAFLETHNAKKINTTIAIDRNTQRLVKTEPYLEDGEVYSVAVVNTWLEHDQHTQKLVKVDIYEENDQFYDVIVENLSSEEIESNLEAMRNSMVLTSRQLRLALNAMGKLDDIEAAISQAPKEVQLNWEYATVFERNHPMVVSLENAIGVSPEEIDSLFELGMSI